MARDSPPEDSPPTAQRYSPRPLTAGEQWTAEALIALRRRRYRPRAWRRFVQSSRERSREARALRPLLARQARAWGVCGAVAWVAAWGAGRRRDHIELRLLPGLAWWLAVWQMLDWHLGMAEGGDGVPRPALSAADAVTMSRFWLTAALPGLAPSSSALTATIVLGGATDWLDGTLARRAGRTRLGRDLDTTADLIFLATAAFTVRAAGRLTDLGFWAIGGREAVGVALAAGAVLGRARRPAIRARPWGALLRIAGLATCTAGPRRTGTLVLVIGCLVPPRSTAPHLSLL